MDHVVVQQPNGDLIIGVTSQEEEETVTVSHTAYRTGMIRVITVESVLIFVMSFYNFTILILTIANFLGIKGYKENIINCKLLWHFQNITLFLMAGAGAAIEFPHESFIILVCICVYKIAIFVCSLLYFLNKGYL